MSNPWLALMVHPPLTPIEGDPEAVRMGAARYMQAAAQIAEAVNEVSRVVGMLQAQSGQMIDAANERLGVTIVRGTQLVAPLQNAARALDVFGDMLQRGQYASKEAAAEDAAAHREFDELASQLAGLSRVTDDFGDVPAGVAQEIEDVQSRMRLVVDREQDARQSWLRAHQQVDETADVAAEAIELLDNGPTGYLLDGGFGGLTGELGEARAAGSGMLAAGLMGRLAHGQLKEGEKAAAVAQLQGLVDEFGKDPAFYAGLMGDAKRAESLFAFLDQAASPGSQWGALGASIATGARVTLSKWTSKLDVDEQRRVGAALIEGMGERPSGARQVLAASWLSADAGGHVAYGAAVALDDQLAKTGPQGWSRDPSTDQAKAILGIGGDAAPHVWSLPHAVMARLSPALSLEFFAPPGGRDLGTARVERWVTGGTHDLAMMNMFSLDRGETLFAAIHGATAHGSTSTDMQVSNRAALLMIDVTHALNHSNVDLETQVSGDAVVELVGAYAPYTDGIGESFTGRSNLQIGPKGLVDEYYKGGFRKAELGLPLESMPMFDRAEIDSVVKRTGLHPEGALAWEYITLDHMHSTGVVAAVLTDEGDRELALATATSNIAAIRGEIDEGLADRAARNDAQNSRVLTTVTGLIGDALPGGPVTGSGVGIASDSAASKLFHAQADELARIRESYDDDAEGMVHAFYTGANNAGLFEGCMNTDDFLQAYLGYSGNGHLSPSEEVAHSIRTEMVAARDR